MSVFVSNVSQQSLFRCGDELLRSDGTGEYVHLRHSQGDSSSFDAVYLSNASSTASASDEIRGMFGRLLKKSVSVSKLREVQEALVPHRGAISALELFVLSVRDTLARDVELELSIRVDPEASEASELELIYRAKNYSDKLQSVIDAVYDSYPAILEKYGFRVSLVTDYEPPKLATNV